MVSYWQWNVNVTAKHENYQCSWHIVTGARMAGQWNTVATRVKWSGCSSLVADDRHLSASTPCPLSARHALRCRYLRRQTPTSTGRRRKIAIIARKMTLENWTPSDARRPRFDFNCRAIKIETRSGSFERKSAPVLDLLRSNKRPFPWTSERGRACVKTNDYK